MMELLLLLLLDICHFAIAVIIKCMRRTEF
jgi:hypothetical protein